MSKDYNKTADDLYEKEKMDEEIYREEFEDVLRQVGLNYPVFLSMCRSNINAKLTDAIEMMYKIIWDKNKTINLLECENDSLNRENFNLNKKNMELNKLIEEMSVETKRNKASKNKGNKLPSKITINNLNINTLSTYQQEIMKKSTANLEKDLIRLCESGFSDAFNDSNVQENCGKNEKLNDLNEDKITLDFNY